MYNRHKEQKKVRILLCQDQVEDHAEADLEAAPEAADLAEAEASAEDITEASEDLIITATTDFGDRADRFSEAGITAPITEAEGASADCSVFCSSP